MRVLSHFVLWSLGLAAPETQTTSDERDCLARYAMGRRVLVEVGVWHGVTTCRLREAMAPDGVLFGVDPYPVGRFGFSMQQRIASAEVGRIPRGTVVWVRETGVEAARLHATAHRPPVEFLFIDGDHTWEGLRGDWESWAPLVAEGGIVALHDSRSSAEHAIDDAGSARFTREVVLADPSFAQRETVDTLTVLQKVSAS